MLEWKVEGYLSSTAFFSSMLLLSQKNKDEKHYRNAYIAYIDVCDKQILFLRLLKD